MHVVRQIGALQVLILIGQRHSGSIRKLGLVLRDRRLIDDDLGRLERR